MIKTEGYFRGRKQCHHLSKFADERVKEYCGVHANVLAQDGMKFFEIEKERAKPSVDMVDFSEKVHCCGEVQRFEGTTPCGKSGTHQAEGDPNPYCYNHALLYANGGKIKKFVKE
jgi:hypothetical protein